MQLPYLKRLTSVHVCTCGAAPCTFSVTSDSSRPMFPPFFEDTLHYPAEFVTGRLQECCMAGPRSTHKADGRIRASDMIALWLRVPLPWKVALLLAKAARAFCCIAAITTDTEEPMVKVAPSTLTSWFGPWTGPPQGWFSLLVHGSRHIPLFPR